MHLVIRVPATTANLGPGFDAFALALGLFNLVEVETLSPARARGRPLEIRLRGQTNLPRDESNLVFQSLRAGLDLAAKPLPPLRLTLTNRIPIGRGLGSSAAAIVGGLVAANALAGGRLDQAILLARAAELEGHPDNVAGALLGGLVLIARAGDEWVWRRVRPPRGLGAVLFIPTQGLSTKLARGLVPTQIPRADAVFNLSRTALLAHAFHTRDWPLLRVAMEDRLHQPYRAAAVPGMNDLLAAAYAAGAAGAALSGAGPSILALTPHAPGRVAAALRRTAAALGIAGRIQTLDLCPTGASRVRPT